MLLNVFDYVLLPDGRLVPSALWARLVLLHERGITLAADGGDIIVRPRGSLTPDDRVWLTTNKTEVLSLLEPAPSAPLPRGWHDVHTFVATIDEIMRAVDEVHDDAVGRRAGRRIH
jgi:hypothetical protein